MTECQRQRCGAWGLSRWLATGILGACFGWTPAVPAADATTDASRLAAAVLDQAGFHGGVIAHVGCDDGQLTAAIMAAAT